MTTSTRSFLATLMVFWAFVACHVQEKTTCIAEGTRIETPFGSRSVESLSVGDLVWSVDPITGLRVGATILSIQEAWAPCLELRAGDASLLATASHPVFDVKSGRYIPLGNWQRYPEAEVLQVVDGSRSRATLSRRTGMMRVFDLTVDSPHRNFVANGFLVHNKTPPISLPDQVENARAVVGDTFAVVTWTVPGGDYGPASFFFLEFKSAPVPDPADPPVFRLQQPDPVVGDSLHIVGFPLRPMQAYTLRIGSSYHDQFDWSNWSEAIGFTTEARP